MVRNSLILFFLFSFSLSFAGELNWIKKNGLWGIVDSHGKTILAPQFDSFKPIFINPVKYVVGLNGKYGLIDEEGQIIFEPTYEDIKWYPQWEDVFAKIIVGGEYTGSNNDIRTKFVVGAIDSYGDVILKPKYKVINFHKGYFSVGIGVPNVTESSYSSGGTWGLHDAYGNEIIKPSYKYCHTDGELIYAGLEGGEKYFRLTDGAELKANPGVKIKALEQGNFLVINNKKYGITNTIGETVIPLEYENVFDIYDGFAIVEKKEKHAVFELGKGVVSELEKGALPKNMGEGMFFLAKNKFFDYKNKNEFKHDWTQCMKFGNGYAIVRKKIGGVFFLINKKGEIQGDQSFLSGFFEQGYWFLRIDNTHWQVFNTSSGNFSEPYPDYFNYKSTPKKLGKGWYMKDRVWVIGDRAIAIKGVPEKKKYGYYIETKDDGFYFSENGTLLPRNDFHSILYLKNNRIIATSKKDGIIYISNQRGENWEPLASSPSKIHPFSEGMAVAEFPTEKTDVFGGRQEKFGFINIDGKIVIHPEYADARPFLNGVAAVRVADKSGREVWQLIDEKGKKIGTSTFEKIGW